MYDVMFQLQGIASFNAVTAAITPLKKTPPHLMEEFANLSPAKPCKSTVHPIQSGLTLMTSQSSLGFHPLDSHYLTTNPHNDEEESDESQSDSSSDSEPDITLEPRVPTSEVCATTTLKLNDILQKQTSSSRQHLPLSQLSGQMHHQHSTSKYHKKKRKNSQSSSTLTLSKKHKRGDNVSGFKPVEESAHGPSQTMLSVTNGGRATVLSGLLVRIPLVDLKVPDSGQQQLEKPKATVEPIVRNPTTSRTPNRRNTADMMETEDQQNRDRYPRLLDEYAGPVHDYGGRARSHGEGRWDRESSRDHRGYGLMSRTSGRSSDYGRSHGWEREHYRGSSGGEDYWSEVSHYESTRDSQRGRSYSRYPSERRRDPEYFMQEARRRKKEADKIMVRM